MITIKMGDLEILAEGQKEGARKIFKKGRLKGKGEFLRREGGCKILGPNTVIAIC